MSKSHLYSMSVGIALTLELAIALSTTVAITASSATELNQSRKLSISQVMQVQNKQSYPPPPPTNPGSSAAGGRRALSAYPQDAKFEISFKRCLIKITCTLGSAFILCGQP